MIASSKMKESCSQIMAHFLRFAQPQLPLSPPGPCRPSRPQRVACCRGICAPLGRCARRGVAAGTLRTLLLGGWALDAEWVSGLNGRCSETLHFICTIQKQYVHPQYLITVLQVVISIPTKSPRPEVLQQCVPLSAPWLKAAIVQAGSINERSAG